MNRLSMSILTRVRSNRLRHVRLFATDLSSSSQSQQAVELPPPDTADKVFSPKIKSLVADISQLSLLEVADLNECLKKTLRIEAVAVAASAAPSKVSEEADEEPKQVKSAFTVKLTKYDETKKVPLIKEVKTIVEGMNLVQAKKFVESVPQILKTNVTKDEAEKMKETLQKLGAVVEIE